MTAATLSRRTAAGLYGDGPAAVLVPSLLPAAALDALLVGPDLPRQQ